VFKDPFWEHSVAVIAWSIAALNIFGLLPPLLAFLDTIGFTIGQTDLTVLLVIKAVGLVVLLLWGANLFSGFLQRRLEALPSVTPSVQILIGKVTRITLIALAFFVALTSLGIDLSIFAVLGGAIGIGVGFGLQKIVGNFISGLILLMDRSIKPGDVIEVGGTYGWVRSLGARYTSVVTRDGHEHLIPNEDFIVNTVTNWSFTDKNVRIKAPNGVAYDADIYKARELVVEAASAVDRVLKSPPPQCHLVGFGDNSVDLELRFWLSDPEGGTANVRSQVLLGIWDRFKEHDIEIPYPQRDIHIKEMPSR
jgi:small-conductance mechanosensitive channel